MMRVTSLVTTLLATNALAQADEAKTSRAPKAAPRHGVGARAHRPQHRRVASMLQAPRGAQNFAPMVARDGRCLDVVDAQMVPGSRLQLWDCTGGANQAWRVDGPLLRTHANLCADLTDGAAYNGARLQVWTCDVRNANQQWTQASNTLTWGTEGWCMDVTEGRFENGTPIQLWQCEPGSNHQAFRWAGAAGDVLKGTTPTSGGNEISASSTESVTNPTPPAAAAAAGGATTFLGFPALSIDAFVGKYPACAPYVGALEAAGAATNIHPTFLGALAMVESTCNPGVSNGFGAFQFMDENAWNLYGGADKNKLNFWDAAFGAARYYAALLRQDGNDLRRAMRDYNGPVSRGGDPAYPDHVAAYMAGTA